MAKYDDVVVGSGVSGLTAASLLAGQGHKVLLLEKAPRIGGSLARYRREGAPFDTGFHFTGGFAGNRLLHDMLSVLRIRDRIEPVFLSNDNANRFVVEPTGRTYDLPCGVPAIRRRLKAYFPSETTAVDRYFDMVADVCRRTTSMALGGISSSPDVLDEDFVPLQQVLDDLTSDPALKLLLSGFCMCYGVQPREVSFASHSRICLGLYESVARVKDGGEAFVRAFRDRLGELGVAIACGRHVARCLDVRDDQVGAFELNTGEEVSFRTAVFTIHPKEILRILPRDKLSLAFVERVSAFESSAGFFSVFGVCDDACTDPDFGTTMVSLFPALDVNGMLDPGNAGDSALVIIRTPEQVNGRACRVVSAFEPSFLAQVRRWQDTTTGRRPPDYAEYKARRAERIRRRIVAALPAYDGHFKVLDSASVLTFRDYLNSPDGSAYGVKQKVGQFNLFGKLPLRNLYAAGQSSVLPGLVGAMVSAFLVCRAIAGKEAFNRLIEKALR